MVSEYGEIGRLVKLHSEGDLVILWAVYEVKDNMYRTSRGWVRGEPEEYFAPRPRERSLRPAILRAVAYAKQRHPGVCAETH